MFFGVAIGTHQNTLTGLLKNPLPPAIRQRPQIKRECFIFGLNVMEPQRGEIRCVATPLAATAVPLY